MPAAILDAGIGGVAGDQHDFELGLQMEVKLVQQIVLVAEIGKQRTLGDAGALGDPSGRRTGAECGHGFRGGIQDGVTLFFAKGAGQGIISNE
ncbi:hypothetical protein LP421_25905 [Rhizobium sp. RCAM05350]|nr:hypothetical protein LP421_25905 [Rhizobium sp. RCAM05350]